MTARWAGPSQRRLFFSVEIHQDNYQQWLSGVVHSESKVRLLEYVHSLWYSPDLRYRPRDFPRRYAKYVSPLPNLRSFALQHIRVERVRAERFRTQCFSAFRETLTLLSLDNVTTSFSAFVVLVAYFPNITTLQLRSIELERSGGLVPTLSRPLRGKVHVRDFGGHAERSEFFNRFSELDLEYEELSIDSFLTETRFLESVLQISAKTVKYLRLYAEFRCE